MHGVTDITDIYLWLNPRECLNFMQWNLSDTCRRGIKFSLFQRFPKFMDNRVIKNIKRGTLKLIWNYAGQ